MYEKDMYNDILYLNGETIESLIFPYEYYDTTSYHVRGLPNLKYLDLSKTKISTVTPHYAYNANKLQTLLLPETLTRIRVMAFDHCTALSEIRLYAKTPP
jgi:Leucine-rich repeat (LRR) protein